MQCRKEAGANVQFGILLHYLSLWLNCCNSCACYLQRVACNGELHYLAYIFLRILPEILKLFSFYF